MTEKLAEIRNKFDKWRVDGLLITNAANRRWVSGFTGSAGRVLITRDKAILATDSRYWEQAAQEASDFEIFRMTDRPNVVQEFLNLGGGQHLGYEGRHMTVAELRLLKKNKGHHWKALNVTLEPFRASKSSAELTAIREGARITDLTVNQVPRLAKVGATEREIAWDLEKFMRDSGADGVAFDIIVATGPNSALPHHHPGSRQLQAGDIIVVDLGASVDGYRSDLTRTFYLGDKPEEKFWEIYNTVHQAQVAAIGSIRAGVTGREVDAMARDMITAAGYGDNFGHGTGHSLGLEIHETPRFSPLAQKDVMSAGVVMTVEPGIYLPGYGGVRIEDLLLVTGDGAEYLSHAPKAPLIPLD